MIYLFALFLITATTDAKDPRWQNGAYTEGVFTFDKISDCEARRAYMIGVAKKNEKGFLVSAKISKCAAAKDTVEYNTFVPGEKPPTTTNDLKGEKS